MRFPDPATNFKFDFSIVCEFFNKPEKILFVYLLLLFYQNNLIS